MRVAILLLVLFGTAHATTSAPVFTSGPERAFNCTHYLDGEVEWKKPAQVEPGDPMALHLPVDKVVKLKLATKRKATFSLETPPPGAKLVGANFEWKVAGTAGQKFTFAFVATEGDAVTRWPITVTIADAKLFTAWSAGMGSVWPDCTVYTSASYDVVDLDGDGRDDVIYGTLGGDAVQRHVMLQRGDKLKFTEALACIDCAPEPRIAKDGTRLLVSEHTCCCVNTVVIWRLDGDTATQLRSFDLRQACGMENEPPPDSYELATDAKQRVTGITIRMTGGTDKAVWDPAKKDFH